MKTAKTFLRKPDKKASIDFRFFLYPVNITAITFSLITGQGIVNP